MAVSRARSTAIHNDYSTLDCEDSMKNLENVLLNKGISANRENFSDLHFSEKSDRLGVPSEGGGIKRFQHRVDARTDARRTGRKEVKQDGYRY